MTNNEYNIFVDTNILIGAYSENKTFQEEKKCWKYLTNLEGRNIFVSSLSIAQFIALFQKRKYPDTVIRRNVRNILTKANVISFSKSDIETSLLNTYKDMEDSIQLTLAKKMKCAVIVTQNKKDYNFMDIDIVTTKTYRSIKQ